MTRFSPAHHWIRLLLPTLLATAAGLACGQTREPGCDLSHAGGAGPFDYRSQRGMLVVVERRHFTWKVEQLMHGESTTQPAPDIDYTLKKFPNHHRALMSLAKLGERVGSTKVNGMDHSVNCYFERALHWWPDDTVARLIFARHLGRTERKPDALAHLAMARRYADDNPMTHYNIGLVALEVGDADMALEEAQKALALGYPAVGLRDQLVKAGKWAEPTAAAPSSASAPASSATAVGSAQP